MLQVDMACWLFKTPATTWPLTFDLETGVRVTCDVGYLCANFRLPRPLCSRVRPDVRDRQTSDVRQKHRLMPPPYGGGDIKAINREIKQSVLKSRSVAARWATLPIAVVFEPFHLTSASRLPHDISLLITDTWCRLRPAFCLSVCQSVAGRLYRQHVITVPPTCVERTSDSSSWV